MIAMELALSRVELQLHNKVHDINSICLTLTHLNLLCYLSQKSSAGLANGISAVVDLEEQPLAMLQCLLDSKLIKHKNRDADCIHEVLNGECITF